VIAEYSDGAERDLTDHAVWKLSDPSLARIDNDARLFALADGTVTVTATVEGAPPDPPCGSSTRKCSAHSALAAT
jgi:hypothetical protein